jgi:hypothetical protein
MACAVFDRLPSAVVSLLLQFVDNGSRLTVTACSRRMRHDALQPLSWRWAEVITVRDQRLLPESAAVSPSSLLQLAPVRLLLSQGYDDVHTRAPALLSRVKHVRRLVSLATEEHGEMGWGEVSLQLLSALLGDPSCALPPSRAADGCGWAAVACAYAVTAPPQPMRAVSA